MFKQVFCNHKTIFLGSWAASVAKGVLVTTNILVMQYMIDAALSGAFFVSGKWLLALAASYITIQLLTALISNLKISINNHVEREVDGAILEQCSEIEYQYYEDAGTYPMIDQVMKEGKTKIMQISNVANQIIEFAVKMAGILVYITAVQWWFVLILLVLTIPMWVLTIIAAGKEGQASRDNWKYYRHSKLFSNILNSREYVKEAKIFNTYPLIGKRWNENMKRFQDGKINANIKERFIIGYINIAQYLLTIVLILCMINPVRNGQISVGALVSTMNSVWQLIGTGLFVIYEVLFVLMDYQVFKGTLKKFFALKHEDLDSGEPLHQIDHIQIEDLWYRYPGEENYVLKGVTLAASEKEHVALVGENGCGKSTLVKLVLGLLQPEKGRIYINHKPAEQYRLRDRRRAFACVFQDYVRYNLTLRENVQIGELSAEKEDAKVTAALQRIDSALLSEIGGSLDKKLGKLTSDAQDISGGQWQKVALARAEYSSAGVIVMDEPTSAIDPILEKNMIEQLTKNNAHRMAFMITHRLGSVQKMDKVIVLKDGTVKACGSHGNLIKEDEYYAKLYKTQEKWYKE